MKRFLVFAASLLVAVSLAVPAVAAPAPAVAVNNNVSATKGIKTVESFKAWHGTIANGHMGRYTRATGIVTFKNNSNRDRFVGCLVVYLQVRPTGSNVVGSTFVSATVPSGTIKKRDWTILGGNENGAGASKVVVNLDDCYTHIV